MADYFTNFSLIVPLPDEPAQAHALKLAEQAGAVQQGDEMPCDFPATLADVLEDWVFETNPESSAGQWGLWLHSSSGGIDAVCAFIQHLLQKFEPTGCVSFEWSHDCSKPRLDAYGGGAAVITARKIKTMSTGQWLRKHAAARAP
ncbi:MAG: hypothetical protein QOE70_1613 [Chthoniobacter sp.]|jgi:hypothetical protein|nr:hypothetical protein [Chthoniobacter sp.]